MSIPGHLYALLVGVNSYDSPALRPLRYATADVLALRECLRSRAGLADERCTVLVQTSGKPPLSRSAILSAFDAFSHAPLTAEDTFLFFFAGHGFALDDHAYLLASDSAKGSRDLLEDTALSLPRLKGFLNKIHAGSKLLILDACRNDPEAHARGDATTLNETLTRDIVALARTEAPASGGKPLERGRAVLNSCWLGQAAYEFPAGQLSWFMKHLLDTLHAHPGGELAFTEEFVSGVGRRMKEAAWKDLPEAAAQEPHLEASGHPVHLALAPLQTLAEPSRVVVKEPVIAPFSVQVESVALAQVRIEGIPDIPTDILELEGTVQGLEEAIRQLEGATHPSLRPGQQAVAQAREQFETLRRDLEENLPVLPDSLKQEIAAAVAKDPRGSVAELARRLPASLPFPDQMDYLARLRNVEEARRVSVATERAYEAERQNQCEQLQAQLDQSRAELERKQRQDWETLTLAFLQKLGRTGAFPVREWKEFHQRVLKSRRYPWSDRELLAMSEEFFGCWEDHAMWASVDPQNTADLINYVVEQHPHGRHIGEANAWLAAATDSQAEQQWEQVRNSRNIDELEAFLKEFPASRHAAGARQALAPLQDEKSWAEACRLCSVEGYRAYLGNDRHTLFVPQARRALAILFRNRLIQNPHDMELRSEYNQLKTRDLVARDVERAALKAGYVGFYFFLALVGMVFGSAAALAFSFGNVALGAFWFVVGAGPVSWWLLRLHLRELKSKRLVARAEEHGPE